MYMYSYSRNYLVRNPFGSYERKIRLIYTYVIISRLLSKVISYNQNIKIHIKNYIIILIFGYVFYQKCFIIKMIL